VMLDTMTWFDPVPDHPNSFAPGKRVLWAGSPSLLVREGRPFPAVGAPGGRKIMSAVDEHEVNWSSVDVLRGDLILSAGAERKA